MAYRVADFARLGGVTVRTLQYYDRIDLLKPSQMTEAGHRLYEKHDLIRLQQIVTLKWMGFSLSHIKTLLDNPTYDLQRSLEIQKAAIDEKINDLRAASDALAGALDALEHLEGPNIETVSAIIYGVSGGDQAQWMQQYYTEDARRGLQTRWFAYTPEQMRGFQQDWADLFAEFEAHIDEAPDSPAVQALAARMQSLVDLFTGGDAETEAGLHQLSLDAESGNLPDDFDGPTAYGDTDSDLRRFMQTAFTIYQERRGK